MCHLTIDGITYDQCPVCNGDPCCPVCLGVFAEDNEPAGEVEYLDDEPEFWFDGGSGICVCGGVACDGGCDSYAEFRREHDEMMREIHYRNSASDGWTKRQKRAFNRGLIDGAHTYVWHNYEAYREFERRRPVREEEIPF